LTDSHEFRLAAIHRRPPRERQNEAFSQWVNLEINRQLRSLPVFREQAARGAAK